MKLDILAFAAHPDDTELACSGTLAMHISKGYKVGVIDLTEGELGTRGSKEIRAKEAAKSQQILGLHVRENLKMSDGFFENNRENQLKIVQKIRKYQPDIILANAIEDRHPDHGRAAQLVNDAFFLSGLQKVITEVDGKKQAYWRPKNLYHYIQSRYIKPDFVVDISDFWDIKMESIKAFASQFYAGDEENTEPETFISSPAFMDFLEARAKELALHIGAKYAEGFTTSKLIGVDNLFDIK